MDEKELIKSLKYGDHDAFKQLFEQYQHYIYNICYRMIGIQEEAEDTTQEVFIKIYHAIGKFRGDAKLSSWIYRIAVNTCLKRERRKKLENWIPLEFLFQNREKFHPVVSEETPHQQIEISETEQIVQQAINQLPARQRTALVLHRYENLSYQEIAQVMEISLSAVESLLHRAKDKLTEKLLPMKKVLR